MATCPNLAIVEPHFEEVLHLDLSDVIHDELIVEQTAHVLRRAGRTTGHLYSLQVLHLARRSLATALRAQLSCREVVSVAVRMQ